MIRLLVLVLFSLLCCSVAAAQGVAPVEAAPAFSPAAIGWLEGFAGLGAGFALTSTGAGAMYKYLLLPQIKADTAAQLAPLIARQETTEKYLDQKLRDGGAAIIPKVEALLTENLAARMAANEAAIKGPIDRIEDMMSSIGPMLSQLSGRQDGD